MKRQKFDLQVFICNKCWLLQTNDLVSQNKYLKMIILILVVILKTWLNHLNKFVKKIKKNFPDKLKTMFVKLHRMMVLYLRYLKVTILMRLELSLQKALICIQKKGL